jgi:hypothetical protein
MPNNVARGRGAGRGAYDLVWPLGALTDDPSRAASIATNVKLYICGGPDLARGPAIDPCSTSFPAAYASYAGRGGYPGYPGFGYPFAVELNGQQTSPPLLTQALSVINNYGAAASAAGFGNANSPANGGANNHRGHFPAANSPGPTIELYNSSQDSVPGYVQAASPQPASAFQQIAVSRGPLIAAAFTNGYH